MAEAKAKLVILSDYGLDDACAGVYCLQNKQLFDGIDIVAIAGNTSAENSLANAKKLLANYEGDKTDVRLVDTTAVPQAYSHLPSIHGNDGMGDLLSVGDSDVPLVPYDDFFSALNEKPFILFSLGPCTLTLQILQNYTPVQTVLMAGLLQAEPNYNGMEFNQALDVSAYNACLTYPHVVATLDTCRVPAFNLAGKRRGDNSLLSRLINRAEELAEARHPKNCYIYDYIAALYLTKPKNFAILQQKDRWGNVLSNLCLQTEETW